MKRIRVAAHVHSEWSYDGRWTLQQISEAFGRRGYDAVLLAEHDRGFDATRWAEYRAACDSVTAGARLVPGIEYSDPTNSVHVPVWGDIPFLGEGLGTAELLPAAKAAGGVAVLAHPGRRDVGRTLDRALLHHFTGIEIWNRKYDGWAPNRRALAYARESGLAPFVSLDFHSARQFFPLAMELSVGGPVTRATVQQALHAGEFQALAFSRSALRMASGVAGVGLVAAEVARSAAARAFRALRS